MSETEADREYYAAGEAAFIRRRGTPFLLSPKDFALLKQWRALGVPIEAVEAGIDEAFSRREERSAAGRVNSLSYCHDAVLVAWERRAETSVGKGTGRDGGPLDVPGIVRALTERLRPVVQGRPDLAAPLESALRSLERLAVRGRTEEETEGSLARLDRRMANSLLEALPSAEREEIGHRVSTLLAPARERMDPEAAEKTSRALTRRLLREKLSLPRLTLLDS
ncbi:MAG: hypothetical protein H7X85_01860 [Thermoanaerobaculia bacterium]|nr:hypothetical protein [Thermoanaerobaculia bacterium]